MIETLAVSIVIGFITAFTIILLKKWGIIEWLQINGNKIISKLASCEFCLSFWVQFPISLLVILIAGTHYSIFIPFIATLTSKKLL